MSLLSRFLKNHVRKMSTNACVVEEIRIPVPWGHIAGKWWGPKNKRPVVAYHGWQVIRPICVIDSIN